MKYFKKILSCFTAILLLTTLCLPSAMAAQTLPLGLPPDSYPHTSVAPCSREDYSIKQIKGKINFTEAAGGFYYAYSPMSTTYQSCFVNVLLPTGFNRAGVRNAYISLGISGSKHGIDLGICNQGSGWMPYSNDLREGTSTNPAFRTYPGYVAPSTAKSAQITAKPVSTTKVHLYVQFQDANGNNVGTAFDKDISVASGNLTMSGGKINCKFFRFASLVPTTEDDQADGSYMTGGMFRYCQLYNGSKYVSWGIGTNTVSDCFIHSTSHITLSYSRQNDTFNIRHNG